MGRWSWIGARSSSCGQRCGRAVEEKRDELRDKFTRQFYIQKWGAVHQLGRRPGRLREICLTPTRFSKGLRAAGY
jgi:hypothetical protein